jgi:hypothetical protein
MHRLVLLAAWLAAGLPGPVAHVLAGRGAVTVKRGAEVRPAEEGLALEGADVLSVPVGGLLLLRVDHNGQVVRLDEDLELAVQELAAVKAPRSERTVEAQLESLLTRPEREALSQQRLAGGVVRPVAAHVAAPASRGATREQLKARIAEQRSERAFDRRMDRLTRDDRLFDDADRRMNVERGAGAGEVRVVLQPPPGAPAATPSATNMDTGPTTVGASSASVVSADARVQVGGVQGGQGGLDEVAALEAQLAALEGAAPVLEGPVRACLLEAVAAQDEVVRAGLGTSVELRLRRGEGGVKVFVEGALPVPACVQAWAQQNAERLPEGEWVTLEVALP